MIAGGRNYAGQRKVYDKQTEAAGLERMHGLRHYSGVWIIWDSCREPAGIGLFGPWFPE